MISKRAMYDRPLSYLGPQRDSEPKEPEDEEEESSETDGNED